MPAPKQVAVLKALNDFVSFGSEVGLPKAVKPLESFIVIFQTTKPTLKILKETVYPVLCVAQTALQARVLDVWRNPKPGMKKHEAKLHGNYNALFDLIFPPKYASVPQVEVVGLAGNKASTSVIGDPKEAKAIAKKSLEVVRWFSKAVFKQNIEAAHSLCAIELRASMGVNQLLNKLNWADSHYGGPAVELIVEHITWIYADEVARKRSNADGDWPKETPKQTKRALVGAFWVADKKKKSGRSIFFWITEEAEGYRVAKFKQYLQ